jgi:hypothetical protein
MGLLAGGVLANSLLLVYLAIGAAALAAIMLTVGVLVWREEVFGPTSAAKTRPTAKLTAGPSPVLAATGVAQQGRSAGGRPADVATVGAAAAQDDFVAEPLLPALPPRPDRAGRLEPQGYPDWPAPPHRQEQPGWVQHSDRPGHQQQPDRGRSPDRPEQSDRARRSDRPERQEQPDQIKSSGRPEQQRDRHQRSDRPGQEEPDRAKQSDRPERQQQPDSAEQAEPVPGPRREEEPAAGVPPASGAASAADKLKPSPAREPAARRQREPDAGLPAWSFFAKPAVPSADGPDLTQVASTEADGSREPAESGKPGGNREADQPPKAARTAEAAPPAHVEPAEPEPISAAAERSAAKGAGPEAEDKSPADTAKGSATRDGHPARGPDTEVTVVPGITRYHRNMCILIRFLGPEDLETMTLQAAEMASYTPCKACRPEQVLADD